MSLNLIGIIQEFLDRVEQLIHKPYMQSSLKFIKRQFCNGLRNLVVYCDPHAVAILCNPCAFWNYVND